jgi:hypothetical protein
MATATSNNSGNWGDDIWDGGSGAGGIPADGDAVVIAEGHSVLMNADLSGWTGLTTLTITGSASGTPGMLYFKNGTNGSLRFRTGTNYGILGTNVANKGRLLANSDGTWRGNKGLTVTGSADADTLTYNSHGLADTTPISFACATPSDVLPAPLQEGVTYYVRDTATNTFKVAATSGGAAIDLTTDGTGTFGVNTCLAFANKAVILFDGTSRLMATYLDISLNCTHPINKYVEVYKDTRTCTDQTTDINTTTGVITFTSAPPANGGALMLKSSGTLPTGWTDTDVYYTRSVSGNTCKLALQNSDETVIIPSATGTGTLTAYTGHDSTATKDLVILQDLTSDGCWVTTAGHNRVVLVDCNAPANYDQQRDDLAAIDTSDPYGLTITNNNVNSAQYPLARVFLSSRNISIRSSSTSGTQRIVDSAVGGTFGCEVRNTYSPGTDTTFYCNGFYGGSYNTVSGTISGCNYGLNGADYNTISGTISGCYYGLYSADYNTISGTISGCYYGLNISYNNSISGTVSGCNYGLYSADYNTISGTISGCSYGLNGANYNTISGTISGCGGILYLGSARNILTGSLIGCGYINYFGTSFPYNKLRSATINPVLWNSRNDDGKNGRIHAENINGNNHAIYDNFGTLTMTACDGTGDAPSQDPDGGSDYCIGAWEIQSKCSRGNKLVVMEEQRIWLAAGPHTIKYKVNTTYAGIAAGNLMLITSYITANGLSYKYTAPAISQRSSASDWTQELSVTFTSSADGWVNNIIELYEYQSGCEVYIWPEPVIT